MGFVDRRTVAAHADASNRLTTARDPGVEGGVLVDRPGRPCWRVSQACRKTGAYPYTGTDGFQGSRLLILGSAGAFDYMPALGQYLQQEC